MVSDHQTDIANSNGHGGPTEPVQRSPRPALEAATLTQLIAETAAKLPDKTAAVFENERITYHALECRSNQLAHHLRDRGVRTGVRVGLCVERSLDMLVGLLGVLKAGGAYVPLDPAYPSDRITYMLEDSEAKFVLTQGALAAALPESGAEVVRLDTDWPVIARASDQPLEDAPEAGDLAYTIYTSGSTGRPKGVDISHRALINFLQSMREEPGLGPDDRLLAVTTLSFDISGLELYLPLLVGAELIIASRTTAGDGTLLSKTLAAHDVTVMQATPATWRLLLESDWAGGALRIFCGGETLTRELAEQLLPRCAELWNLYGPTETTIWSTVHRVESGEGPVSIGHPIANTDIVILDDDGKPVADDTPGELCIGGDGLADGYFKRPELTAERFIAHPTNPGARLYRTGDLAKQLPDGTLHHMGRLDFQVKVRGFRIELGEIEAGLDRMEAVRQSVVLAREDVPGEKRLVAYVIPASDEPPSVRALRAALAETLPDYMVPGLFQFMDAFPLTPNGKVDRKALPKPDLQRPELFEEFVAPSTERETMLADIWSDVLRVDQVGVNDDFFELGGDSLKVAQMATRLRDRFGVDVPLRSIFEHATVTGLLPVIESLEAAGGGVKELPLAEVKRGDEIPLSFAQERVWFIHQLNPQNLAYNFHSSISLKGPLDVDALERTLGEILRRHESYRTSFPTVDGRPVEIVHAYEGYTLRIIDFSDKSPEEQRAAYDAWCAEEFQLRFDLAKIPLVLWTLFRMSEEDHILIHMEHHLVHDGWSFNIFLRELVDLYAAFSKGEPSPLPELPVQFAEFATWQHQWMQGEVSDRQLAYWKKKFQTIPPVLELPTKGPRPAEQTFRGTSLRPEIPLDLCAGLRALSRDEGATLFMTMLAGHFALLHRYTGEVDIPVGTFFANRRARESEHLIGMILNNVVIRTALDADPTVSELIQQVRGLVLEGADHQDVPFDRVVEAVQPQRDLGVNPLFQLMFSFHDEPMPEHGMPGLDVKVTPVLSNGSSKFDLGVIGIPHSSQVLGLEPGSENDGLTMIWEHNTDLFETSTIARMIEHYKALLRGFVADPSKRISELALDTVAEHRTLIAGWNDTGAAFPADAYVHEMVAAQAAATPTAVAVACDGTALSYAELDTRSNKLANHLRAQGVGPDMLVGLCVERSETMVIGLLGILKAGGAYVPIDPMFPADRQQFMVEDAAISILVTEKDLGEPMARDGMTLVRLDQDAAAIAQAPETLAEPPALTPESRAYVIYTSGSTGRPKGVQIPHRALVNFLCAMRERPGLAAEDRLMAVTTLSFDIAGLELYLPLIVGGRVIVCSRDVAMNGEALAAHLRETGATVMQATPTTWQMLIDSNWPGDQALTALCGGEALPRVLADQLVGRVKALWNMYGPTETTIWSTVHKMEGQGGLVPIGTPIHNTDIHILDAHGNTVPVGAVGELCIGGRGVALGYLNRPELTAERFIDRPSEFSGTGKLYRTGDLARYLADGTLECLGRTDHQIKLRGFRIELGEIESLLDDLPEVAQSVAITWDYGPGDTRLVAYVVPAAGSTPTAGDLLAKLEEKLPHYMTPSVCMILDEMPLTPNGKIDRRALPEPKGERQETASAFVAPRNDAERTLQQIWQDLLGISPIGVRDDFFEIGGHSLLAVRLVSAIEQKTKKRVSLAALLQGRTIEFVARIIGGDEDAQTESGFVPLKTDGTDTPFFAGGSHPKYAEIATKLGDEQPIYQLDIYALQSQRMADGLPPIKSVEEMARHYLKDLRRVQPKGPYHLGGGCEGAYVAFEMALQLQEQGDDVDCLVMWIPPPLRVANGFILQKSAPYMIARQLRYMITGGALRNSGLQALKVLLKHEYIEYVILRALNKYRPRGRYRGKATIVRTEFSPVKTSADLNKPWADRCDGGAEVHVVPGDHDTWFERHIDNFVGVLRDSLDEANRRQAPRA